MMVGCNRHPCTCVCATAANNERPPTHRGDPNRQTAVRVNRDTSDVPRSSVTTTTLLRIHYYYIQQRNRVNNRELLQFYYGGRGGVPS